MAKLIMTVAEMQDENKWLEFRNKGIGGSDSATIVGLNPWKSQFQLWLEKTGQVEQEDLSDNEKVYWGKTLEQVVADRFCELTGKKVRKNGLLQHCEYDYLLASVDRMVVGENAGLECKTANTFAAKDWEEDKLPVSYYLQCQHYMLVTGCEKWYIAVLIGGQKFIWKEVPRNEEDINGLLEAYKEFWHKVQNNIMPDVDGSEDCKKALGRKFAGGQVEAVTLPIVLKESLIRIDELKELKSNIETEIAENENKIKIALGDNEVGLLEDRKVTWKSQNGRTTVDSKKLKADLPDIYSKYSKVGNPVRVFKIS